MLITIQFNAILFALYLPRQTAVWKSQRWFDFWNTPNESHESNHCRVEYRCKLIKLFHVVVVHDDDDDVSNMRILVRNCETDWPSIQLASQPARARAGCAVVVSVCRWRQTSSCYTQSLSSPPTDTAISSCMMMQRAQSDRYRYIQL